MEYRQSLARGLSIADMNGGSRCMVTRRQTRNQLPPICLNFEIEGAWLNFFLKLIFIGTIQITFNES